MAYLDWIPGPPAVPVLFEDNHLLVVQKPAGLLTQGDASGRPNLLDLAKEYIRLKYNKPGPAFLGLVHRLDRPVAGVMVLARTSKAASRLSHQFRDDVPHKTYLAVLHGRLEPAEGRLEILLAWKRRKAEPSGPDDPRSQHARLSYRVLGTAPAACLVEIRLHTGRRHQIRTQMAAAGHPIWGDELYGSTATLGPDVIALLAQRLEIQHPISKESLIFTATPTLDWPWPPSGGGRCGGTF